ncbi:MAG: hypothetical protein K0R38_6484 [Polyangiaceae bacterium]|jgi:hypothetical protein|nr:hypothetical protein [Polyangiaceae bacterium]
MPKNKLKSPAKASVARKSVAPPPPSQKSVPPAAARKSVAPPPPGRKSVAPPAARKSVAPGGRKPAAAGGRKSVIPPAPKVPRKLGLRGAAPWALRHAERQAAEALRRNQEPPKPGSARATLREPQEADRIKASIGELHGLLQKLRGLQKNLNEQFFELGEILRDIEARKLHEAKGYSSIETFAERELALGKGLAAKLVRIPALFQPQAAKALKLDALSRAIDAIDQAPQAAASRVAKLPLKPPR